MGLFDLPAPLFAAVDHVLGLVLPSFLRLGLWGIFAGWLTMMAYRKLSNQEEIGKLKAEQKIQQQKIVGFDGEFNGLLPLIRHTLSLGFRQLGLAIGPALLATIPVLFLVAWVAGQFGYETPAPGNVLNVTTTPIAADIDWQPVSAVKPEEDGWQLTWPDPGDTVSLRSGDQELLTLPTERNVPVIHKKQWWNCLFANPIGYVPEHLPIDQLHIALPEQKFMKFGPGWMQGWMFTFFLCFLLASIAFKLLLKID